MDKNILELKQKRESLLKRNDEISKLCVDDRFFDYSNISYVDTLLVQNENEAKEWLIFLNGHIDNEELKSLENEISDRFFGKFDVQIGTSELDNKRTKLMKKYILKSNEYLK